MSLPSVRYSNKDIQNLVDLAESLDTQCEDLLNAEQAHAALVDLDYSPEIATRALEIYGNPTLANVEPHNLEDVIKKTQALANNPQPHKLRLTPGGAVLGGVIGLFSGFIAGVCLWGVSDTPNPDAHWWSMTLIPGFVSSIAGVWLENYCNNSHFDVRQKKYLEAKEAKELAHARYDTNFQPQDIVLVRNIPGMGEINPILVYAVDVKEDAVRIATNYRSNNHAKWQRWESHEAEYKNRSVWTKIEPKSPTPLSWDDLQTLPRGSMISYTGTDKDALGFLGNKLEHSVQLFVDYQRSKLTADLSKQQIEEGHSFLLGPKYV